MPRITVKGLTIEKELLEHEITLLQQKNDELQADLDSRRDRSRSRRRKVEFKVEPISARTMMALDIVCKRDRDSVIDEQRKIMTKQAQEIELLRSGGGPIGPILLALKDYPEFSQTLRASLLAKTETVKTFIKRTEMMAYSIHQELQWGEHNKLFTRLSESPQP